MAPEKRMSFIGHLEDLRWTLVRSIISVIACAIPCGIFWREIFDWIAVWPLRLSDPVPQLIYTSPVEAVFLCIRIALTCGAITASPFIFQQVWSFLSPALYKKEKAIIFPAVLASTFCFLLGITFCYFMLPLVLNFLTSFAGGQIEAFFKISEYFSFLIKMCTAFGFAFELPVISFILSKAGIINYRFLVRYFRHAVVIIFIAAAILTPPDVLSQILLALPLLSLYGISIFVSWMAGKKDAKSENSLVIN